MVEIISEELTVKFVNKKITTVALDGVNATFPAGSFNVMVGYSGSGKTTFLRAVAGLIDDYDGNIYFDGMDMIDVPVQRRNVSFVSQQFVLYPNKTIFDNIAFPLKVKGAPQREITEAVYEIADKMDLTCCLTRLPKHLSGGQQQRVAIARALVKHPDVCLLDEPLSNVDYGVRGCLRGQIKNALKSIGCTVIYVTHDFSEAMALADNIFVMNEGKIEIHGKPDEVFKSKNETVKLLRGSGDMLW